MNETERAYRASCPADCQHCDRICPVCDYPIDSGWVHVQQPQPAGASHTVCSLERPRPGSLVDVVHAFFDHAHLHPKRKPTS